MESIGWVIDFILCIAVCFCGFYVFKLYKNIELLNESKKEFGKMINMFSASVEKSERCLSELNQAKDLKDLQRLIEDAHRVATILESASLQAKELIDQLGDTGDKMSDVEAKNNKVEEKLKKKTQNNKISLTQKDYYDLLPKITKTPSD
ncbi:hypothetical protein Sarmat_00609 [Rickettsiales endosymbiont of Paramecium tredecaurelia]|uniref:hypothetical protein n=1 Tax=Candidatus Sarmatiella mevalonica TaxID=2770581 RepID=UPI0019205124|nr:hypothetical protein [Candidatus Sarmatiella mevalonica]MBL3284753.1 hypothetical protein [Candidatus Sarmatiella mevalonica]